MLRIENERKLLLEQLKLKGDLDDKERDALLKLNTELAVLDEIEKNRLKKIAYKLLKRKINR